MKISQEVRDYAEKGMAEMSDTFREQGAEIYKTTQGTAIELP